MPMCKRLCLYLFFILSLFLPQLACGGGGGSDPKPTPLTTYTATFSPLTNITMAQTSYSYQSGSSFSFTYTVPSGFQNTVAAVTQGTGSVNIPANNVPGTYTGTATGTSNLTISLTATASVSYTATFAPLSNVTMAQTSYTYSSGATTAFSFSVLPGYQNPVVQKVSGTGSAIITSASSGTFTGTSDLVFSITASLIPPPTYTATFSPLTNVTMSQTSYSYTSGSSFSFSYTVPVGFQDTVATVTQGTGTVNIPGNNVPGTYTGTATGTSNLTISLMAVQVPGVIAFVVSPEIITAMRPLIDTYMNTVATETGCESLLIEETSTPAVVRTRLKSIANLKCALLIGNIPIVKRQRGLANEVNNGILVAHEHYYRALAYTYKDPVLDSDGYFRLPDEYRFDNWEPQLPSFSSTISLGRIMGPSKDTMVSDVRLYIEKNLRLRNTGLSLPQTLSYVEAFDFQGTYSEVDVRSAYSNHPFGVLSLAYDTTGVTSKAALLAAFGNSSYVRVSSHGGVNGLNFNATSYFDSRTESPLSSQARYIHIDSCGSGDIGFFVAPYTYLMGESMATRLLMSGDTLLVSAATESIFGLSYASIHHAYHNDFSLGVGRRFYNIEKYGNLYKHEMTYFGDPTIAMKNPNPSPASKIVIGGVALLEETELPLVATGTAGENKFCDVVVKNEGSVELEVRGDLFSSYTTTAGVDRGNGGRWWITGYDSTTAVIYGTIKIAPGSSKTLRITLNKRDHGGNIATGAHEGYFHFSCNDPKVGAFRISVKGTL